MTNIDWKNLPFGYQKTDYNVRTYFRDGRWGSLELSSSEYINMHIAATTLHYGQEAFEGMKAFVIGVKDGPVHEVEELLAESFFVLVQGSFFVRLVVQIEGFVCREA